jgi:hypothetical protein
MLPRVVVTTTGFRLIKGLGAATCNPVANGSVAAFRFGTANNTDPVPDAGQSHLKCEEQSMLIGPHRRTQMAPGRGRARGIPAYHPSSAFISV